MDEIQIGGGKMSHGPGIYCLAVEAGFYSDEVEFLPVNPATWVPFPAGTGRNTFALRQ